MEYRLERLKKEIEKRMEINQKSYIQCLLNSDDARDSFGYKIQEDKNILSFIDSMQKECKFKVGDRIRLQGTTAIGDAITNIYTAEDDKVYFEFENSDDALADLDWELVEWSKKCMYSNDNYTDEDRKVLCEDCDEPCEYVKKEPVSEDLWEAAKEYSKFERGDDTEADYDINRYEGFIAGAEWQKEMSINKACEYLKDNIWRNLYFVNGEAGFPTAEFIKGFRKAMEE